MSVAHRVSRRFLDQQAARRVVSRLLWAMSRDEAKRKLKLAPGLEPTDAEINAAYKALVRDAIRSNPDAAINQEVLRDFNIAKDTLRGQFDRKAPGSGQNAPDEQPRRPPPEPKREREAEPPPPPIPEGDPFTSAMSGLGTVDWKVISDAAFGYDVVVEQETPRLAYFAKRYEFILIGRTSTHYVFAKLTQRQNTRNPSEYAGKDDRRWVAFKTGFPIERDLVKIAPKAIKALSEGAGRRRTKFKVLEGTLTAANVESPRATLSLLDAISGSGLLAEGGNTKTLDKRKIQIEIEPILNREKYKAWKTSPEYDNTRARNHLGYDWFVYANGKSHELLAEEIERLIKNYFLFSIYAYDYHGKKNLTRLKGGGVFKPTAKDALGRLAEGLNPGSLRTIVEAAAQAAK